MKRLAVVNYRLIMYVLGIILMIEAFFMLFNVVISYIYHEPFVKKNFFAFLITFCLGFILFISNRIGLSRGFSRKDSFLLVTLSWLVISLFGTLPYLLTQSIPLFTNAFFESVSGFTTTGSSILTDIEVLPKSMLFWRSLTHWIGGMGIIVLFIALFPMMKVGKIYLFNAEASVVVEEKTFPRIFSVARTIWLIYILLTFLEIILLYIGGMNLFDSVCHAFATVATGGFSTKNTSIGNYSPYIQYVVAIFMILSATNFNIYLLMLKKKFSSVFKNEEWRTYLLILFIIVVIVAIILYANDIYNLEQSFRYALFNVASLMSATGFATTDYLLWPALAWMFILLVMFIGASSGSTGGGVKVVRYVILIKKIKSTFQEIIHPNIISPVRYNGHVVEDDIVFKVLVFIIMYFIIVIVGTFILLILGVDPLTAFGSSLTAMGGMGPGLGLTGPAGNFSSIPVVGKYILIILMLIGRLEIFSVLILFTKEYWK